jgi:hypothetical protein
VSSILTDRTYVPLCGHTKRSSRALQYLPILIFYSPATINTTARLAQSVERKALNLVVVGSSPTVGDACTLLLFLCVRPSAHIVEALRWDALLTVIWHSVTSEQPTICLARGILNADGHKFTQTCHQAAVQVCTAR